MAAAAAGLVNGYGDGKFGPEDPITREQIIAILYRYAAYKGWDEELVLPKPDAYTYSDWAESSIAWAEDSGLLDYLDTDMRDLTSEATRAEIAAYLRRFCVSIADPAKDEE